MKDKIIKIVLCGVLIFMVTACNKEEVSIEELKQLQEEIGDKVSSTNTNNFASCFVDEEERVVVVELINNTKEERQWFLKNIVNSKHIKFKQGGPYTTSSISIEKETLHDTIKFNQYYVASDRTIYLAGNIKEVYLNTPSKIALKEHLSKAFQTLDDSIASITSELDKKETLKDGKMTVYHSKKKDITMVVCTGKNKDVYLGDYSMQVEDDMCKE